MSKDKSINVCRNWEITKFGQKCRISIIRKLLKIKMFTPEAVEGFKERRQLRRAVKYMEIILHQIRENKYPFPLKFSTGSIELGSTLERKLANLLIPEVIESLKAKGRLRDALRYMRLLFPEPHRTPQVNDVITSTKYTLGIKVKNGNVNINNLDINIFKILPDIVQVYRNFNINEDVVITSGNDSNHKDNSLHYQNKAIDLRSNYLTDSRQLELANKLKKRLGKEFYVLSEHYACKDNNHIHIGYQIANTQEAGIRTECKIKEGIQRIVDITDTNIKSEQCIKNEKIKNFYIRKWDENTNPLYCK